MKNLPVYVNPLKQLIQPSPGFAKKQLSESHLDVYGLCNFGCKYCSSNSGNYLRIRRERFAALTEQQLGRRLMPADNPELTFMWRDVLSQLERELSSKRHPPGEGMTIVFSMLTDSFGPLLVSEGITEGALRLLLERTKFRVRVLTKSAVVGSAYWVRFFKEHADRFVIGLSIGTDDPEWARAVEIGTSSPKARLRALRSLQDAGVATYGMACPIFPDLLEGDRLERLVDEVRPQLVEHFWAEPYNDRVNWRAVRDGYKLDSNGYRWLTETYENKKKGRWSVYASELYTRLRRKAEAEGWLEKLRYLLYEGGITEEDAGAFRDLKGVLLQSKPGEDGLSTNPHISAYQKKVVKPGLVNSSAKTSEGVEGAA